MKNSIPLLLFILLTLPLRAQEQKNIKIQVSDAANPRLVVGAAMAINLRSGNGIFSQTDGSFQLLLQKNDTVLIRAYGYKTRKLCFTDSLWVENRLHIIPLYRDTFRMREVTIAPTKSFDQIEREIQELGYDPGDFKLSTADAFSSPITALYEAFSRKEKNHRKLAEMINNDNRRAVLKSLLRIYNRSELIDIQEEEMDEFIDYLRLSDEELQSMSQYDLALYVSRRYTYWRELRERGKN